MDKKEKQTGKLGWKIILITSVCLFIICAISLVVILAPSLFSPAPKDVVDTPSQIEGQNSSQVELIDNPIDFAGQQEINPDIYAWIQIPGTTVDYPVLQSDDEPEDFYLNHDVNGKYKFAGCIYSQMLNSKDFSDPNTILYGHNMNNGSMFASLHKFRNTEFFNENKYIYIYTPGHILTYTIYAAYRYDNRHILYAFDLNNKEIFAEYIEMTKSPKSTIVNVRNDVEVTAEDKIITLSTCITNDNYRYLVQGVLTSDQPTK
jgi:sortase B